MSGEELSGVGSRRFGGGPTYSGGQSHSFVYDSPVVVEDLQKERIELTAKPVGGVGGGSPYEIELPFDPSSFLDMSSLRLRTVARVTRQDGSDLGIGDVVAPINLFGSSLWSRTEVVLDDLYGNQSSAEYSHFKNFLETILSYEGDARETHLRTQMFYQDTPGRMDHVNLVEAGGRQPNAGFVTRAQIAQLSRPFDVVCPLPTDILRCSKHLVPGVKVTLKLTKENDAFLLMTDRPERRYRVEIVSMELKYARIVVDDKFKLPPLQIFPFPKTHMKKLNVPQHSTAASLSIERGGLIPKQILIFMVKASAAAGHYGENPFNFEHFGVNTMRLVVNGLDVPRGGLKFDWINEPPKINDSLAELYTNIGVYRTDRGCSVNRDGYAGGQFIVGFDLTPDKCNGRHLHRSETGTVTLELSFSTPVRQMTHVFAHCVYDCVYIKKRDVSGFDLQYI